MSERPSYYNEELKARYIEEKEKTTGPSDFLWIYFKRVADTEFELDKDASNWTSYEILECYKMLNSSVFESIVMLNSVLSQYTQFCLENNLVKDNQNHYLECTLDILLTCVNKTVFDKKIIDRKTVLDWVRQLPNAKDQFILLSLFEYGKSKDFKDILEVRPSDLKGNELTLSDRTVVISDDLRNIIHNCMAEDRYYPLSVTNTKTYPLVDSGYIVKYFANQNMDTTPYQKGRNIYMHCQRIFDYLGVKQWMSANAVAESGKIHMIKTRAQELGMSPMDYFNSPHFYEVEERFGIQNNKRSYLRKYGEYLV